MYQIDNPLLIVNFHCDKSLCGQDSSGREFWVFVCYEYLGSKGAGQPKESQPAKRALTARSFESCYTKPFPGQVRSDQTSLLIMILSRCRLATRSAPGLCRSLLEKIIARSPDSDEFIERPAIAGDRMEGVRSGSLRWSRIASQADRFASYENYEYLKRQMNSDVQDLNFKLELCFNWIDWLSALFCAQAVRRGATNGWQACQETNFDFKNFVEFELNY